MGAWIETASIAKLLRALGSHPMWVRGLKQTELVTNTTLYMSHPMWVRGLKLLGGVNHRHHRVAPHVGAWIETLLS